MGLSPAPASGARARKPKDFGRRPRLGPGLDSELTKDGFDVMVDRSYGKDELVGDLSVLKSFRNQGQHLELPSS